MASSEVLPLCDVEGCVNEILCWVDGIAHCQTHLEAIWDRWQAMDIFPGIREYIEPMPYRQNSKQTRTKQRGGDAN